MKVNLCLKYSLHHEHSHDFDLSYDYDKDWKEATHFVISVILKLLA